ncbi:MAG: hypothetical protein ISR53_09720 [Rhodospirillales bacterium]|nr:hypothetical protein [Rhodospirillales bacterium]
MIHLKGLVGILFAAVMVMTIAAPAAMADSTVPLPSPAKAFKGKQCVEPADVMRRQHMTFLNHQRDETMRQGIRGNKYSLQQCINCHATADPKIMGGTVRTLQPFCGECHEYAAVNIDCFACHNPTAPLETSENMPLDKMIAAHLGQGNPDVSSGKAGGAQ